MPHAHTESPRVGPPTMTLLEEPGWQTVPTIKKRLGPAGTFKRVTPIEVVVIHRIRAALERFKPLAQPKRSRTPPTRIRPVDLDAANKLVGYVPHWA